MYRIRDWGFKVPEAPVCLSRRSLCEAEYVEVIPGKIRKGPAWLATDPRTRVLKRLLLSTSLYVSPTRNNMVTMPLVKAG